MRSRGVALRAGLSARAEALLSRVFALAGFDP